MQIDQLASGLAAKFKSSRLVFWYDPEQNFLEALPALSLSDVTVINMAGQSVFEIKKRIELDEPEQRFLLYFPQAAPDPEQDWMLDVRLYSEQFYADVSSMLLNELGIGRMSLRTHIGQRKGFFNNKQRVAALKRWVTESEDELSLDRKMIAVVVRADSASIADSLLKLLQDYAQALEAGSENLPLLRQLRKFGLEQSLWMLLAAEYGYDAAEPSFTDFSLRLFCTDAWSQMDVPNKEWLSHHLLKTASGRATGVAFMVSWRDSRTYSRYYDALSAVVARKLEISRQCAEYQPLDMMECETFEAVEQNIIRGLVQSLRASAQPVERTHLDAIVSRRLTSHWCQSRKEYEAIYLAIRQAGLLLYLRQHYTDGFHYDRAEDLYDAYVGELYQFDQAYRLFNEHVQAVQSKGADVLRPLDELVENLYSNWYLYELAIAWDQLIAKGDLMDHWKLEGVANQYEFFSRFVQSDADARRIKRIFVIVSDALRYEVAEELARVIDREKRFKTDLASQLGVLPSYTQLGMAALLPHQHLSYGRNKGDTVFVDGQSSMGLDNRHGLLQAVGGMAVSAKELMGWSNLEGREKVSSARVVYIYHDSIDAIGDKQPTEGKTFEACRNAIDELKDLVTRVINRFNASLVLVTADHGFLFQKKPMEAADKTALISKPPGTFVAKKRYLLGRKLPSNDFCWKGRIADTANGGDDTEFLIPKGYQRFHFVGGARFVHGGAMPQEICVPVLKIKSLRKKQAAIHEKQPVGVVVASQPIRLVSNIDKVRFIQTDPVGDAFVPRQLDIYIVDNEGKEVSSRETLAFDSRSKVMDERTREVRLKLIGAEFNRNLAYTMVLVNADTGIRYTQYAVTIDLAFQDDFF